MINLTLFCIFILLTLMILILTYRLDSNSSEVDIQDLQAIVSILESQDPNWVALTLFSDDMLLKATATILAESFLLFFPLINTGSIESFEYFYNWIVFF